jgi:hypothetical protein
VARAAATLLARTENGVRMAALYDGVAVPSVRLLCFQERCLAAARASSALSLGSYHTAAVLRKAGGGPPRLHTFGRGFHGQLGRGGYDNATAPTPVAVPHDAAREQLRGESAPLPPLALTAGAAGFEVRANCVGGRAVL